VRTAGQIDSLSAVSSRVAAALAACHSVESFLHYVPLYYVNALLVRVQGSGLAVTSMYTSAGRRSDDEDKENSIISSSLDSDAYDRLSRSRTKPKFRDYRRSKSEVRPSDLKLASEEMFAPDGNGVSGTSTSLQHKELPASLPSEARATIASTPSAAAAAVSSARTVSALTIAVLLQRERRSSKCHSQFFLIFSGRCVSKCSKSIVRRL